MLRCMKTLLFALFVFTIFSAAGQKKTYTPFTDNGIADKEALSALTSRYEKDIATLSGSYKKFAAEVYKERFSLIKNDCRKKKLLPIRKPKPI